MPDFSEFKKKVQKQYKKLSRNKSHLFVTDTSKNDIWDMYLDSFPAGTNPIYKESTDHDCNACKSFIRSIGNIVAIKGEKLVSIWDIDIDNYYQEVADALSAYVKLKPIRGVFLSGERYIGYDFTHATEPDGTITKWEHFYVVLQNDFVVYNSSIGSVLGKFRTSKEVFQRGLDEISVDALQTVLELIEQNSLYLGNSFKSNITTLLKHKKQYIKANDKDLYCWRESVSMPEHITHIKNTSIGTLLMDISEGRDLDSAVSAYESITAPTNYKRPTALITQSMINNAQQKVADLDLETALERRYATIDDISITDIIYVDKETKISMSVFDDLKQTKPVKQKNLSKIEEISIETFMKSIVPSATKIEMFVENSHANNFVSLIAPVDSEANNLFAWDNNFSWTYNGDLTDSIKERVKNAGGDVNGVLRMSLSWFNKDDLDIHCVEPDGSTIYYGNSLSKTGGKLDVDMNASSPYKTDAVENITWPNINTMQEGNYSLLVHNFNKRSTENVGFEVEVEYENVIHTFSYSRAVRTDERVHVADIGFSKKEGIKISNSIPSTSASKEIWNISTSMYHKVSMIMLSPNYWNKKQCGNKHFMFMIDECKNDESVRGFFNEYLKPELSEHRKVFEVLGSKMKVPESSDQLSGLGFSSTIRKSAIFKVQGTFNRTVKVKF